MQRIPRMFIEADHLWRIHTERLAGVSFKDILCKSLMINTILGSQQQNGGDLLFGTSSADFVSKWISQMPDVGKIKHCWEDNCVAAENEREVEKRRLFLPHQICSAPDAATSENLETVSHSVSVHQRHLIGHFPPHNSLISSLSLNNQLTSLWYWTHICDSTFTVYPIYHATNQNQPGLVKPAYSHCPFRMCLIRP